MKAPIAKKIPKKRIVHNDLFIDDYDWIKDRSNPDVITYIQAENAYTQALMEKSLDLQDEIYQEMRGHIQEADQSKAQKVGEYFYYTRTETDQEYLVYCRKHKDLNNPEEILLNVNIEAQKHPFYNICAFKVSPNHQMVAFAVDMDGSEAYQLLIKDLNSGEIVEKVSQQACTFLEWANDSTHLFYTVVDGSLRPFQLFRHVMGSPVTDDVLIYTETDSAFFLQLDKTKDKQYILMNLVNFTTTEVRYVDAHQPLEYWRLFQERISNLSYKVEHNGQNFYILTNYNAPNFCVMTTPQDQTLKENWQLFYSSQVQVKLDSIEVFKQYLALYEREAGLMHIRILDIASKQSHRIPFTESAYLVSKAQNPDFDSDLLAFNYSSLVQPASIFSYHFKKQELALQHKKDVPAYQAEDYHSERILVEVEAGVQVPLSIVYKKSLRQTGPQALHLYAYGAYGTNVDPYFSSHLLSLLDRGFIYAIAHVRGGGILGPEWYERGKLNHKKNSFNDFIACAEHLIEQHYTSPQELSIEGRSAGGLLMGAVVNLRPDLFRAVVAEVPFVDVTNTMLDDSLALTVTAYEEWGNPNQAEAYTYMRSYSPYDNVSAQDYPHMLVISGMNDPRVTYWEPTKWVARLRALKTGRHKIILKTHMNSGHMGASGRFEYLKETAFKYAFLLLANQDRL